MSKRPDFVVDLPDGSTEQFFFKAHRSARPGELSWMRKIVGLDGETREVWHEVADAAGRLVHAHRYRVAGQEG